MIKNYQVVEQVIGVAAPCALLVLPWIQPSAIGSIYLLMYLTWLMICCDIRGKLMSVRSRSVITLHLYRKRRKKWEPKIWRSITIITWFNLAFQVAMQLVFKITYKKMSPNATQIFELLGFYNVHNWQILKVYGSIICLMILAYCNYYFAKRREAGTSVSVADLDQESLLAECRKTWKRTWIFFLALGLISGILWPSAFGLVYIATVLVCVLLLCQPNKQFFLHRQSCMMDIFIDLITFCSFSQIVLLYFEQMLYASHFASILSEQVRKALGAYEIDPSMSDTFTTPALQILEIIALLLLFTCSLMMFQTKVRYYTLSDLSLETTPSTSNSSLMEPLLLRTMRMSQKSRILKGILKSEEEWKFPLAKMWHYFVNICACCVSVLDPSLLSNILLLLALFNIFAIQHNVMPYCTMSICAGSFCLLLFVMTYMGSITTCSDKGILAFIGLSCHTYPISTVTIISVKLLLAVLYGICSELAKCNKNEVPSGRCPSSHFSSEEGRPKFWMELSLVSKLFCTALVFTCYILNLFAIPIYKVNVMNFIFAVLLIGHMLFYRTSLLFMAGQLFAMLYLVLVSMCSNASLVLVLNKQLKNTLLSVGLLYSSPLVDLLPKVTIVLFNLLACNMKYWFEQSSADQHMHNLKCWKIFTFLMYWVHRILPYGILAIIIGEVIFGRVRCFSEKCDSIGLAYMLAGCLLTLAIQTSKIWAIKVVWVVMQGTAILDYVLQMICFSSLFGLTHFSKKAHNIFSHQLGCLHKNDDWWCFLQALIRPLLVLLLIRVHLSCQIFLARYQNVDEWSTKCKSLSSLHVLVKKFAINHGTKILATLAMVVICRVNGVVSLLISVIMVFYGISPKGCTALPYTKLMQSLSIMLVLVQYAMHIEFIEKILDAHSDVQHTLEWMGILVHSHDLNYTICVSFVLIIWCHIQILVEKGAKKTKQTVSRGTEDSITSYEEWSRSASSRITYNPAQPSILPRYYASSSDMSINSIPSDAEITCPSKDHQHFMLLDAIVTSNESIRSPSYDDQDEENTDKDDEHHDDVVHNEASDVSSLVDEDKSLSSKCDERSTHLIKKRQRLISQVKLTAAYLKFQLAYFERKYMLGIFVIGLLLASTICLNVYSLVYLSEIATLLLVQGSVRSRICTYFFLPVNILMLFYAQIAKIVIMSPFVASDRFGCDMDVDADRVNFWIDFCSNNARLWAVFICTWFCMLYNQNAASNNDDTAMQQRDATLSRHMRHQFLISSDTVHSKERTGLESFYKFCFLHSLDFTLILVVIIAMINIDIFHLGYFGLGLFYMRCRENFWDGRYQKLWLVILVYNFLVILAIVAYQAPWSTWFGPYFLKPNVTCTWQHVLGVYSITHFFGQLFKIETASGGLMYDVVMFIVIHLQYMLFGTEAFEWLLESVQRDKRLALEGYERKNKVWRKKEVMKALEARSHRRTRKHRVEWLKQGLLYSDHGSVHHKLRKHKYFETIIAVPGSENEANLSPRAAALNPFAYPEIDSNREIGQGGSSMNKICQNIGKYISYFYSAVEGKWANRRDTDSYLVYALLIINFVYEFSIMTLVFPIILFTYALMSPGMKSKSFWNSLLYYVEICLTVRYCFWIPFEHECHGFPLESRDVPLMKSSQYWLLLLGIYPKPFPQSIPMILLYLSLIWHFEAVLQRTNANKRIEDSESRSQPCAECNLCQTLQKFFWSIYNFLRDICTETEHAPYIIQVTLKATISDHFWATKSPVEIQKCIEYLYNLRLDPEIQKAIPAGIVERLAQVSVSFSVDHIESELDREDCAPSDQACDVVIVELPSIVSPAQKKLMRPASDVATLLKHVSDFIHEKSTKHDLNREFKELEDMSIPDFIDDFLVVDSDAVARTETDYYVQTLCADILSFNFALIFYQACVSARSKSLTNTFSLTSVFPADYVGALVILFLLIVCDRVIYIKRSNLLKVLYHFGSVAFFLSYLMIEFWSEGIRLTGNADLKQLGLGVFFLFKALSFSFSSRQLRAGFPGNTLGHWLMKHNTTTNFILYQVYRMIPFLQEMRAMLDWTCTHTTLELFDWFRVEEIRSSLFLVDMANFFRQRKRQGKGLKQAWPIKFFQGVLGFSLLSLILWGPLLLYTSNNPAIAVPTLMAASVNVTLVQGTKSFPLLYGGQDRKVQMWTHEEDYFQHYERNQIKHVILGSDSDTFWGISPPRREELIGCLSEPKDTFLELIFEFQRNIPASARFCTLPITHSLSKETIHNLKEVLEGSMNETQIKVKSPGHSGHANDEKLYNLFVEIAGDLRSCEANNYFKPVVATKYEVLDQPTVACSLGLKRSRDCSSGSCEWWSMVCESSLTTYNSVKNLGPQLVLIFEKTIGETVLGSIFASRGGLIGLYVSFVLVVGRFIHLSFSSGLRQKIPYDELPSTENLKTIVGDIDSARAENELAVEEELYWGLIRIYRSPAVLFELTKKEQ